MRRRISWLVLATTSVVVVSFVVPLCLLVRTIAQDRAMAAADQEARNVAILVTGLVTRTSWPRSSTVSTRAAGPTPRCSQRAATVLGSGRSGPG